MGIAVGIGRLWRKGRRCYLLPVPGGVAAPQLGPEMAEIERGIDRAVASASTAETGSPRNCTLALPDAMAAR